MLLSWRRLIKKFYLFLSGFLNHPVMTYGPQHSSILYSTHPIKQPKLDLTLTQLLNG